MMIDPTCCLCTTRKSMRPDTDFFTSSGVWICGACIDKAHKLLEARRCNKTDLNNLPPQNDTVHRDLLEDIRNNTPSPQEIVKYLDRFVIGQDHAKKTLALAAYSHITRLIHNLRSDRDPACPRLKKSNIILLGPTGCGKSFLLEKLSEFIKAPLFIADATTMTEAGYIGGKVEDMLEGLLDKCSGDIAKAEEGIIYIDEVDKISSHPGGAQAKDPSGVGAQQSYLKLIEGSDVVVNIGKGQQSRQVKMNTKEILFICGGAFSGLDKIIQARTEQKGIGFNANVISNPIKDFLQVTPDDVIKYGFLPEFIGRFPVYAQLLPLTVQDLKRIILETEESPLKEIQQLFSIHQTDLKFTSGAVNKLAETSMKEGTGARGLRTLIHRACAEAMYACFNTTHIEQVTVHSDLSLTYKWRASNESHN